ncbi:MAG TPA: GNAT family N-acetyltransferase, partial [Candidatus Binatia bacterium]|nr:GNAT family N-acetyltransferase [Candidatus Binatia bacterium]
MSSFRDNITAHRYELDHEGGPSFAEYRDRDGVRYITHVETPHEARGQGHSGRLMAAIVESARDGERKLVPQCGYAVAYFRRNKDAADVLS